MQIEAGEAAVEAETEPVRCHRGKAALQQHFPETFKNTGRCRRSFDSPKWEELYKARPACGTCTFVCPTCQCYDIRDYNTGNGIQQVPLLGFLHVLRFHPDGPRQQP
ncbi:MAG: 4Fe-4S dicluster domain-containing protein [Clostridium sp.]